MYWCKVKNCLAVQVFVNLKLTVTVDNDFKYFTRRTGFRNGTTLMLDSPFSSDQVKMYIPSSMPEPSHENYNSSLLMAIPDYLELTHGKAFVLFTRS